ncbi:Nop14-like family-domain-containing protein, partial [Jimgerdemannia flammicorona]
HERQKEKEEDEDLRKELDDGLDDIRDLLFTSDGAASDKDKPKRRPLPSQTLEASRADPVAQPKDEYEDYDRFVRELAFDRRAQPQDRMKSEEEVAAEEKAKLEKAERMRKRRMEGLEDEDDEEEEEADTRKGRKGRKSKKQRIPEADDLEDDFMAEEMEEEAGRLGRSLTVEDIMNAKRKEEDESEEEKGDEDEEEGEDEGEYESDYSDLSLEKGSGDDCDDSEDENGEAGDVFADSGDDMIDLSGKTLTITSKKLKPVITNGTGASPTTVRKTADGTRELPYVFPCPMTHRAFVAMFRAHDVHVEDEPIIVQRIRTLYHIKLAPENLQKLETFFAILLEHLVLLASPSSSALPAHLPLATLSRHARHLFELAQQMPEHAAVIFVERLRGMQAAFLHERVVPGLAEVVVLRVLGQVFPTSDFQHPVATPAMLFVGQCLEQGKVATEADVAKKIVLAQVLYEYQTISKRFLPEPLNFLISALVLLTPKPAFPGPTIPGTFPLLEGEAPNLRLERPDLEPAPLDAMALLATDGSEAGDPQRVRASLISASLAALDSYTLLYSSTPAFVEVFGPVVEVVREMKTAVEGRWSTKIEKQITALEDRLTRQLKFAKDRRQINPLKLQSHKPVPIATFVPKFEEGYVPLFTVSLWGSYHRSIIPFLLTFPHPQLLDRSPLRPRHGACAEGQAQGAVYQGAQGGDPRVAQGRHVCCAGEAAQDEGEGCRIQEDGHGRDDRAGGGTGREKQAREGEGEGKEETVREQWGQLEGNWKGGWSSNGDCFDTGAVSIRCMIEFVEVQRFWMYGMDSTEIYSIFLRNFWIPQMKCLRNITTPPRISFHTDEVKPGMEFDGTLILSKLLHVPYGFSVPQQTPAIRHK